ILQASQFGQPGCKLSRGRPSRAGAIQELRALKAQACGHLGPRRGPLKRGQMRCRYLVPAAVMGAAVLYACGGGGSSQPIAVSVTAASSKHIDGGQSMRLYASVTGGSGGQDVTWAVSCTACGAMEQTTSASGVANVFQAAPWNPNESRSSSVTVTATSVSDPSKSASLLIAINPSLMSSSPVDVQDAVVGSGFQLPVMPTYFLGATPWGGGTPPISCVVESGALPAGLKLDSTTNIVSGVPTTPTTPALVTFACTDSAYQRVTTEVAV